MIYPGDVILSNTITPSALYRSISRHLCLPSNSQEKQTCWKGELFGCCNNSCDIHRGVRAVSVLLLKTQNCRCCLMTQLKCDIGPVDYPRHSFTCLRINKPALFFLLTATIPSFYKHLSYLRHIRADQMHSAMRERLLPHDCHVGRLATCFAHVSQPWIHCNTPKDTHRHTEKKACALLAHILGLPARASLNSAFNLAHRWRVLTALHPALCTHAHTQKHPHSRHQELVLENCNTNWEKKKHRSEAVSGKDDSGENSFSYNWSKRQKKKTLWSLSVCECTSSVCTCMHACTDTIIPWHFTVFVGHLERGLSPHGWAITETRSQTAEALWQTFWSKAS